MAASPAAAAEVPRKRRRVGCAKVVLLLILVILPCLLFGRSFGAPWLVRLRHMMSPRSIGPLRSRREGWRIRDRIQVINLILSVGSFTLCRISVGFLRFPVGMKPATRARRIERLGATLASLFRLYHGASVSVCPSTAMTCPLMCRACGDVSHSAVSATSEAVTQDRIETPLT